jgi:ankyrin repeat protein
MLSIKLFSKAKSTDENSPKSEESTPRTPRSPFSISLSFRKRVSKRDINDEEPTQEKKKVSSFFGVIDVKEDNYLVSENELAKLSSKFSQLSTLKREKTKLSNKEFNIDEDEEDVTEIVEITSDGEDDETFKIPQITIEREKSSKQKMEEMIVTTQKRKTRALSIMTKYETSKNFEEKKQNTNENEKKLFEYIKNSDMNEFQMLISSNGSLMDLDWKNPDLDSITLLHAAIFSNNHQAAEILIKYRVNIEILDNRDRTPLHISSYLGRVEIIAVLLSNGAKVNVKDGFGNSPLHILMKSHHFDLFDALVLSGCDLNFKTSSGLNL